MKKKKICNVCRSRRRCTTNFLFNSQARHTQKRLVLHGSHISNIKSIAAEIKAALAYYRKVSAKRNKRLLGVYIDASMKAEFTDELIREETSQEDWKEEQMNAVRYLVDTGLDVLGLFKPPDLLDRSDRFAAMPSLDGTSHGNPSPGEPRRDCGGVF